MKSLFVDIRPLRESLPFRRFWLGGAMSSFGGQMTWFAVQLQVFVVTGSVAATGAVGLAQALPGIAFGLFGGAIADATDRRRLVLWMTSGSTLISAILAAQAFAGNRTIWPLFLLVAGQGLIASVSGPARRTFLRRLLPAERITAAAALQMTMQHIAVIGGPALAGVLAGFFGLKICYLIDTISFLGSFWGVAGLPAMPPEGAATRVNLKSVVEGLSFIGRTQALLGALLADVNSMVLGMPIALFPAINVERFGGHTQLLGVLTAAIGVGGVLGSVLSGPAGRAARPGRLMLICGAIWGLGIAGFGLAHLFAVAVVALIVAGAADVTAVVLRTSMVQQITPDRLRGRVSAAESVVGAMFPQIGSFRAGIVGSLTTPAIGVYSGGFAVVVGTVILGRLLPRFVRWTPETALPPSRES